MVRFAGYAKKEDPKWVAIFVYLIMLLVIFTGLFGIVLFSQWLGNWLEKKETVTTSTSTSTLTTTTATIIGATTTLPVSVYPPTTVLTLATVAEMGKEKASSIVVEEGIKIERIVITSKVENNLPTDELENVSINKQPKIYASTRAICSNPPQPIKHVWLDPNGHIFADIDLTLSRNSSDTYSYISIYNVPQGRWQIQVKDAKGNILGKKEFSVSE
jgi:hypothetical protein